MFIRTELVFTTRLTLFLLDFGKELMPERFFTIFPVGDMPCYECALGDGGTISARAQANHHVYSNQEQTEGLKFEPGISVDINFITTIGIKLIIDMLNISNTDYIPRLLNDFKQYTVVCNTSNPEIGGEMVEIFSYPLQITTSLVVDFRNPKCKDKCICKYELEDK